MIPLKSFIPLRLLIVVFVFSAVTFSPAQERCGTVEYTNKLISKNPLLEKDSQFEKWLTEKLKTRSRQSLEQGARTQTSTYQIPVVIHVIHNGEQVGVGTNISDAQIQSQIDVLNKDFQRLNADAASTHLEFLPVAGSMDIEFVMAKQNPAGQPTTGIVRKQGTKSLWQINDDVQLKATSYWPSQDYFNIWICNLSQYLGYTQFPVSTLPGLEDSPNVSETDGVVIGHLYFGSTDAGPFNLPPRYDKGRTVTHEVGHFFGLRHIWGDVTSDCSGTDYISDTPSQRGSTSGCPSTVLSNGCTPTSAHKMYQNYLDYTDDACMNLFTKEQVIRMITVLENSPRRASLPDSHGLVDPALVANNIGIERVTSPLPDECTHAITPSIEIKNTGNNAITSVEIQLEVNSLTTETITFPLNLTVGESIVVNFSPLTSTQGNSSFLFRVLETNGGIDGESANNVKSINTLISDRIATPFEENFMAMPAYWKLQNQDQQKTWVITNAPMYNTSNTAAMMDFYNYDSEEAVDVLISPPFDLTNETLAFFSFDVAHARYNSKNDGLKVFVLTNCNTEISSGTEVYYKTGDDLATTTPRSIAFIPKNEDEWRKEVVDLSAYLGQNNVRIAFVGINDFGNNLYLDNVSMITSLDIDLAVTSILNPSMVTCEEPFPRIIVQNIGTANITSFNIESQVNAGEVVITPVTNIYLKSGEKHEVTLPATTLKDGNNFLTFNVVNPNNGGTDINESNNQKSTTVVASPASLTIPFREDFKNGFELGWTSLNPTNGMRWKLEDTNYNTSVSFNAFNNVVSGDEAWLVSPLLDFSYAREASVLFDRSYAFNDTDGPNAEGEQLRILASVGCGNIFDLTLYDGNDIDLSTAWSQENWKPASDTDWLRESVNLSTLAGKKDVRLAFVITNRNGNNIYLDNLEFYTAENPNTLNATKPFTIINNNNNTGDFSILFKLEAQQPVELDIIDVMGRLIHNARLDHVLNQTHEVLLENVVSGVYIVRLQTPTHRYAQRVVIQK